MHCHIVKYWSKQRNKTSTTQLLSHIFQTVVIQFKTSYKLSPKWIILQWRHNGCDSVSNHQPHDCLLKRLFRRRSKKTSKLCVTGLCVGNSPATGEFPAQMASNAENVFIWWRHHNLVLLAIHRAKYNSLHLYLRYVKHVVFFNSRDVWQGW